MNLATLATVVFFFSVSFVSFGLVYTLANGRRKPQNSPATLTLFSNGELDMEKVIDLIEKNCKYPTTVGIITETIQPKKPVQDPERQEVERNIYVRKKIDPTFFLLTTFFNLLPEYFTLQAELMLIEDMGIEATAQAYDRSSIDTLIKELLESKSVEDKEYYTNLLLDIKAKQKA